MRLSQPAETVEPYVEMMDNARRIGSPRAPLTRKDLLDASEVWILDYA